MSDIRGVTSLIVSVLMAASFGIWQHSWFAGAFMFFVGALVDFYLDAFLKVLAHRR